MKTQLTEEFIRMQKLAGLDEEQFSLQTKLSDIEQLKRSLSISIDLIDKIMNSGYKEDEYDWHNCFEQISDIALDLKDFK